MNKIEYYSFEVERYKQELKARFSENEILELIALQLNRDCSKSAISIDFSEQIDAKAIQEKLLGIVKSISNEQFEQFAYIIDLPAFGIKFVCMFLNKNKMKRPKSVARGKIIYQIEV